MVKHGLLMNHQKNHQMIKNLYQRVKKAQQEYGFLSQKYRSEGYVKNQKDKSILLELFSSQVHEQWSHWMTYLFSKSHSNEDGSVTIPTWAVERWKRQMITNYKNLTEVEKISDKNEAEKFIKILEETKYENS